MTSLVQVPDDLLYPSSDGNPIAESTIQYRWIVTIKENLEILFVNDPNVFIAGNLLWHPVQVPSTYPEIPAPSQAPDVMVVFGVPKGDRSSYKQFKENNIPSQVVFEILSHSNKMAKGREKMQEKFERACHLCRPSSPSPFSQPGRRGGEPSQSPSPKLGEGLEQSGHTRKG